MKRLAQILAHSKFTINAYCFFFLILTINNLTDTGVPTLCVGQSKAIVNKTLGN